MRRVFWLLPFVLLAACAASEAPPAAGPPSPAAAGGEVRAAFPSHGLADTIAIDAVDRLPLVSAVLVAPDGGEAAASYLNAAVNPTNTVGQWAASHAWQDAVTDSNAFAATTKDIAVNAAISGETQLQAVVSEAEIPLPDPVAYRRDWRRYRIRLTFGVSPTQRESREIPAPAPPPAGQ